MVAPPSRPFHWPGGIPPEVKPDANGDITPEEADEDAKGWLLFVEEKWVPRTIANVSDEDGDYETRQRRALVETWAKASQDFRDSYHQRAPLRKAPYYPKDALQHSDYCYDTPNFICLPPLGPSYRSNRSKWIKLYILSCRLDGEMGHCMDGIGANHGGIDPNPATFPDPSSVQITDVLPRAYLEMASFNGITMTHRGTVLFMNRLRDWFVATADDLDTGHITIIDFKRNGQIRESFRRRAYNMYPVYLELFSLQRSLTHVINEKVGGPDRYNTDLDMTQPVIDILEGARERHEFLFGFDGGRDGWTEDIEIYAPGYLELEAAGHEADYDHARLIDPEDAYDIRSRIYQAEIEHEV